jgi:hypothetical protein
MTMIIAGALLACLLAVPAFGQSALRGEWQASIRTKSPSAAGVMMIDGEGRVTYNPSTDTSLPPKFRGYIANVDAESAHITLTEGASVWRLQCMILSSDLLKCVSQQPNGKPSNIFMLTRRKEEVAKLWKPGDNNLQGTWRLLADAPFAQSSTITIDAQNGAALAANWGAHDGIPAGAATATGYVRSDGMKIEIIFTKRTPPNAGLFDRLACVRRSATELDCVSGGSASSQAGKVGMVRLQ